MPRNRRIFSSSGYMHIISRGNGRQIIFEGDSDYNFYLMLLKKYSLEYDISIIAYCLMSNHVHILVHDRKKNISKMMLIINSVYSRYFNKKYERFGYLFQDRFLNENIESEQNLLGVFRYILNNPAKACIAPSSEYKWNSYHLYCKNNSFVDTSYISSLIGDWHDYVAFIDSANNDNFLEYNPELKNDTWAAGILQDVLGIPNGLEIKNYPKAKRDKTILLLKQNGLSGRQIERLTGISRGVIQKIK